VAEVKNFDKDCLFCNIIKGDIPSTKVYEDENCYAFPDIAPKAPVHIIVVPKTHIVSCAEINEGNAYLAGQIFTAIAKIARQEKLDGGYRVVTNCGEDAGQTVPHLHFHILAGKKMDE